jgi:hypothetical protein
MKILLLSAVMTLAATGGHDSETERLRAHPWAAWTDGSWVKSEIENPISGKMTTTESLVSVGTDAYRLKGKWDGSETETSFDHGYGLLGYPHLQRGAQRVGEETLTIQGVSFDCQVWKARWNENGKPFEAVAWVAEGQRHPLRVKQKGNNLTIHLEITKLEDWIVAARRKFRCARYEGTSSYDGRTSPVTQWRTFDIPGGVAKTVSRVATPEGTVDHTNTVVEFRGTPRK